MEQKRYKLSDLSQLLEIDDARIQQWIELDLVMPSYDNELEYFVEEDIDRLRVIRNLIDDLEVNQEGVDVILGMRQKMISMEKWMRDVFAILDANNLLNDELIEQFKKF